MDGAQAEKAVSGGADAGNGIIFSAEQHMLLGCIFLKKFYISDISVTFMFYHELTKGNEAELYAKDFAG